MVKKRYLWFGFLISALFLYLAFREVDFYELLGSLKKANYLYLVPAAIFVILFVYVRALRWRYLLEPVKKIKTYSLFKVVMIGFMVNNVLPARVGEVVKAMFLGRKERISKTTSLATIVVEHIFDGFTLLFFLSIISIYFPNAPWIRRLGYLAISITLFTLFFLFMLIYRQELILKWSMKITTLISPKLTKKMVRMLNSFTEGLQVLQMAGHLIIISILSLIIWVLLAGTFYFVGMSFNLNLHIWESVFLLTIVTLGTMIPSSPGFVGTFQFFCKEGLLILGIKDHNLALSYAVVVHMVQYLTETLPGFIYLWTGGISLKEIAENKEDNKTPYLSEDIAD